MSTSFNNTQCYITCYQHCVPKLARQDIHTTVTVELSLAAYTGWASVWFSSTCRVKGGMWPACCPSACEHAVSTSATTALCVPIPGNTWHKPHISRIFRPYFEKFSMHLSCLFNTFYQIIRKRPQIFSKSCHACMRVERIYYAAEMMNITFNFARKNWVRLKQNYYLYAKV